LDGYNFLPAVNTSEVIRRRSPSPHSLTLLPWNLHNELGWPTTAQGGDLVPRRIRIKTALPAEAHIADVKSTAKEAIAHSAEARECTINTGKLE
jgi:hypothetical protein